MYLISVLFASTFISLSFETQVLAPDEFRHRVCWHCPRMFAQVFWFQVLPVYRGNALQCLWFNVHAEGQVQYWLRDTNGMLTHLEILSRRGNQNAVNVTEGAASERCAAVGGPRLLARVPLVSLHPECEMNVPHVRPSVHFPDLSETPPPLPRGRIDKTCYPFSAFLACLQGLWPDRCAWNLSEGGWGRGGSSGGISIRFPDTTSRSGGCSPRSLCLRPSGETFFQLLCIRKPLGH